MACNLPVVSVPVGDVEELIREANGYVICQREPVAIAKALLGLLASSQAVDGRETLLRKKLDTNSVARQLLDIYSTVLSRKNPSPSPLTMETR